jgi:hypothetical protein
MKVGDLVVYKSDPDYAFGVLMDFHHLDARETFGLQSEEHRYVTVYWPDGEISLEKKRDIEVEINASR